MPDHPETPELPEITVLLVEARREDAVRTEECLAAAPGTQAGIVRAARLSEALDELATRAVDAVLLNPSLPDSSGSDAIHRITAAAGPAPVIVLSSSGDDELADRAIYSGAADCLLERDMTPGALARAIANSRDRQKMMVERDALARIGRIVSSTLDLDTVLDEFACEVKRLMPLDRMAVGWLDRQSGALTDVYEWGVEIPGMESRRVRDLADASLEKVMTTGSGVFDTPAAPPTGARMGAGGPGGNKAPKPACLLSAMIAPLISDGEVAGTLEVQCRGEGAYGTDDLRMLERIAYQISGMVVAANHYGQTLWWAQEKEHTALLETRYVERVATEREALADISCIISASLAIEEVYDQFAGRVRDLIDADRIVILLFDQETQTALVAYESGMEIPGLAGGTTIPISEYLAYECLEVRTGVFRDDNAIRDAARTDRFARESHGAGIHAALITPITWRDDLIGAITLSSKTEGAYQKTDLVLLQRIADQIGGVIANARLRDEISEVAAQRAALAEIGRAAAQDLDLPRVFERVADQVNGLIPYDRISVALLDPDSSDLRLAFFRGASLPGERVGDMIPAPVKQGRRLEVEYPSNARAREYRQQMIRLGLASHIQAEILFGSEAPAGYLSLRSRDENAYSRKNLDLLESVASQVSPAIQNARVYKQTAELAREKERNLELEARARELNAINTERSRFLSTVSHELKTPLASLLAFADILSRNRDANLTSRQLEHLGVVQKSGRRLDSLINDLLDISRLDGKTLKIEPSEFSISELINDLMESLSPMFEAKAQQLGVSVPEGGPWINADRGRVYQVMSNLLSNASKYSPEGTRIEVRGSVSAKVLRIDVADQGPGIRAEEREQVFRAFFRVDNEFTRSVPGTGLGLAVSRALVELHGGRIYISGEPREGSTFTLELPGVMPGPSEAYMASMKAASGPVVPRSRLDDVEAVA